jgi:hypothetical protein
LILTESIIANNETNNKYIDFPDSYTPGPKNLPIDLEHFTPGKAITIWFSDIWSHAVEQTNTRIQR